MNWDFENQESGQKASKRDGKSRTPNLREPSEMLYSLLLRGGRIEDDGYIWCMEEEGDLAVIMKGDSGDCPYCGHKVKQIHTGDRNDS